MANWSESDDSDPQPRPAFGRTPLRPRQAQPQSQTKHGLKRPASRARRSISPPSLARQSSSSYHTETASSIVARGDGNDPPLASKDEPKMGAAQSMSRSANSTPKAHRHQSAATPGSRNSKQHTPRKPLWTVEKLEDSLKEFADEIGKDGAKRTVRLMRMSWKKKPPELQSASTKNWFADMKCTPVEGGKKSPDTMKIKTKQVGAGRSGKMERREHYRVICIKTDKEAVPRYNFHHVDIVKNILSPNTMLTYVPHLRDLADNEEKKYRNWLENLEIMDKTSGFATLSRQQKVIKTIQKERATTLLLYLDRWLSQLGLQSCTKQNLIRHMTREMETATPQQKSSILNNDDGSSPRSSRMIKMFTQAFDNVFNDERLKEQRVPLQEVLLLDKSVDTFGDPKKWMKETPGQAKVMDQGTSVETFTETYSLLGCLICFCHSCEHGEFGVDNERKRFSVEMIGGMSGLLERHVSSSKKKDHDQHELFTNHDDIPPCGEDCYKISQPGTRARSWTEVEINVLKAMHATSMNDTVPIHCAVAQVTGRPCWDVKRQLDKLDLPLPATPHASPLSKPLKPPKAVPWYDRKKKMLIGDWQDQTITHKHQLKETLDPCNHEGPCTEKNGCVCAKNGLLCERFCRCTAETCAIKFTGCACHSLGKVCMPKQKDRPCICIQLNRECDPALCGDCGVVERADPANADNDLLHATGCQNCDLQRARPKSLVLGKSRIAGYGLFAAEDIPQDEFVIEYVGELISQDEGVRREARRGDVFDESANTSYLFTLLEQEGIWVDAAIYGNLSRYINHQDDGCNVTPRILFVNGEYRIKFSSLRDIKAGDELFFNYGENFPNLTKKLLEEEEQAQEKQRKAKEREADGEDRPSRKKPGPKPGKKRGGKQRNRKPKKTFATLESDLDDDEDVVMDDVSTEEVLPVASRKRKRVLGDEDGNDTDSKMASHSLRGNTRKGDKKPGPKPRRQLEIQDTADEDTATQSHDEVTIPVAPASDRKLRRDDKLLEPAKPDSVADADEVMIVGGSGRKSRNSGGRRLSHVESRFEPIFTKSIQVDLTTSNHTPANVVATDESPSRSRRTLRHQPPPIQITDSSPLSELNYRSDSEDVRPHTRGRRGHHDDTTTAHSKQQHATRNSGGGAELNNSSFGSAIGASNSVIIDDESDDSAPIIDRSRSRMRRKPARYDD